MVTPPPAQLDVPLWVAGDARRRCRSRRSACPSWPTPRQRSTPPRPVAPGRATLVGDVDTDRQIVIDWSSAGATHLLCALDGTATVEAIARWLVPEVAMVEFPRVVTETPLPVSWPYPAGSRGGC